MRPVLIADHQKSLIILSVEKDGPAAKAGVLVGDILISLNGQGVGDTDDVQTALRGSIGKELPVVVLRGGVRAELQVRPGERRN